MNWGGGRKEFKITTTKSQQQQTTLTPKNIKNN